MWMAVWVPTSVGMTFEANNVMAALEAAIQGNAMILSPCGCGWPGQARPWSEKKECRSPSVYPPPPCGEGLGVEVRPGVIFVAQFILSFFGRMPSKRD